MTSRDGRGRGRTWSGTRCTMAPSASSNTSRPPEGPDRSATIVGRGSAAADLYVYLAQHHGATDAQELGRIALAGRAWN